jgi:hypothetical protein
MSKIQIPYSPHAKQRMVHQDDHRFRVVAAGRRGGKTTLAVNELIRIALSKPNSRSWYVAPTLKQAKDIVWNDPHGLFHYLPKEMIEKDGIRRSELSVRLINGHIIELKGAENRERLRGVGLVFVVLDEYGYMADDVWTAVIRPMLADCQGNALFIGTPDAAGSPHFHDLFNKGQTNDPLWKSWRFVTKDNVTCPGLADEVEEARASYPPEIFKREYEADFSLSEGLIYDNFDFATHVIPSYEPDHHSDMIIGSIDPGLVNETAAILTAWDKEGNCRIFKEYYQKEFNAYYNGEQIRALAKPYKVAYWVIDRAASKREGNGGPTVYDIYSQFVRPIYTAKNDPGSVNYGINEVKKLLQPHQVTKKPKLYVSAELTNFLNEIQHYSKYRPKYGTNNNPPDKPRKFRDHLMDCIRNLVYTRPWLYRGVEPKHYAKTPKKYGGY